MDGWSDTRSVRAGCCRQRGEPFKVFKLKGLLEVSSIEQKETGYCAYEEVQYSA